MHFLMQCNKKMNKFEIKLQVFLKNEAIAIILNGSFYIIKIWI